MKAPKEDTLILVLCASCFVGLLLMFGKFTFAVALLWQLVVWIAPAVAIIIAACLVWRFIASAVEAGVRRGKQ